MANVSGNLSDRDHYDAYDYYEYEYDYDASVNNLPLEEFIPSVIVYSITLLVGVVGNSLVIFSIAYYGRQKNVTNVFLLSLASADLLLVTICVPIKVRYNVFRNALLASLRCIPFKLNRG